MYPAMIQIEGQPITLIGGGTVAFRKAKAFLEFGGIVTIISTDFTEQFELLDVHCQKRTYTEEDLQGSFIVVAATNNPQVNEEVGRYCKRNHILCNVIDNPKLSSFIVPAYMKRGDLVISVSTQGKSPSLARKIRDELEDRYDETFEEYLAILGRIREQVLIQHEEEHIRKQILQHIITLEMEELQHYEKSYLGG